MPCILVFIFLVTLLLRLPPLLFSASPPSPVWVFAAAFAAAPGWPLSSVFACAFLLGACGCVPPPPLGGAGSPSGVPVHVSQLRWGCPFRLRDRSFLPAVRPGRCVQPPPPGGACSSVRGLGYARVPLRGGPHVCSWAVPCSLSAPVAALASLPAGVVRLRRPGSRSSEVDSTWSRTLRPGSALLLWFGARGCVPPSTP